MYVNDYPNDTKKTSGPFVIGRHFNGPPYRRYYHGSGVMKFWITIKGAKQFRTSSEARKFADEKGMAKFQVLSYADELESQNTGGWWAKETECLEVS